MQAEAVQPETKQPETTQPQVKASHEDTETITLTEKDVKKIDNLMQEALLGRTMPAPADETPAATQAEVQHTEVPQEPPGPLHALQTIVSQIDDAAQATSAILNTHATPEVLLFHHQRWTHCLSSLLGICTIPKEVALPYCCLPPCHVCCRLLAFHIPDFTKR